MPNRDPFKQLPDIPLEATPTDSGYTFRRSGHTEQGDPFVVVNISGAPDGTYTSYVFTVGGLFTSDNQESNALIELETIYMSREKRFSLAEGLARTIFKSADDPEDIEGMHDEANTGVNVARSNGQTLSK